MQENGCLGLLVKNEESYSIYEIQRGESNQFQGLAEKSVEEGTMLCVSLGHIETEFTKYYGCILEQKEPKNCYIIQNSKTKKNTLILLTQEQKANVISKIPII